MIDLQTYAMILIVLRTLSAVFIVLVIKRQIELFKYPIHKSIRTFRVVLFLLSLAVLTGNVVPFTIDVLALFGGTNRPDVVPSASIIYSISVSMTAVFSAILIWLLYFIAKDDNDKQ